MPDTAEPVSSTPRDRGDVPVLVVDDQECFRQALRCVIDSAPGFALIGEACSGEEAASAVVELAPELVLMDVVMPGIGGVAAARSILKRRPAPRIVLISVDELRLRAGAASLGDDVVCVRKQELVPSRLRELWEASVG